MSYRNVAYLPDEQVIRLFTWDEDGKRMSVDIPHHPYFYMETTQKSDGISIFNTPLKKFEFPVEYRRGEQIRQMVRAQRENGEKVSVRVFENLSVLQQFLIDRYWKVNDTPEFTEHPLKIQFIDIETYSPDEFPVPEFAKDTVNVITLWDSLENHFYTWGLQKDYKPTLDNVTYKKCKSERDLLLSFVEHIEKDHPDIISGWNSEFFDMPYLMNRITKILGEEVANRLSPVNVSYKREFQGKFGKMNTRWHLKGVSCVDYLDIYKGFTQGLRESYKLNDIAELELGEKKIEYGEQNLASLADNDWQTFVDYNIQDVNLLVRMEEKLQFMMLLRMLAYVGLTPLENAMGTINVVTGAATIEARSQGKIVPTFEVERSGDKYEGAYVGEPERGFRDNIVSFDLNSLYPSIMISLNLSPETKVGKFEISSDGNVVVTSITGKVVELTKEKFARFVEKENISITRANCLFSQKKKGIFPLITDKYYDKRKAVKKDLAIAKRKLTKLEKGDPDYAKTKLRADQAEIKQLTIKILINRIYGYFGNKVSPMGDPDITRSITLTGQSIIKKSNKILTDLVKERTGLTDDDIRKDPVVIYNDTDSVYVTIKHLIEHGNIPFTKGKKVSKEIIELTDEIETILNNAIKTWGEYALNSQDCRFEFKREAICSRGIFLQKKRYILHVLDDEGIPVDKFKYTGVEVVRTTMPKAIKPHVKNIIETMIRTKDYNTTNTLFNEMYELFDTLPLEDIAFVMGVKSYTTISETTGEECNNFKTYKGMPIHAKSAYFYNYLLEKSNLTNKYEAINSGDKVRYFYCKKPNKYGIPSFGYKYTFPKEFSNDIQPDREKMFEKIVYSVFERLYESVGWKCRKPGEMVQTDLFDLLKI